MTDNYSQSRAKRDALKKWISNEITLQLRELKEEMDRKMEEDLYNLRQQIITEITTSLQYDKNLIDKKINDKMESLHGQIVVAGDRQTAAITQNTKELVLSVGKQVQKQVYNQVINEINEKIVPKVNNMVEWVNYNMQDGGEIVSGYRRAVEAQSCSDRVKLLTDTKDKRIISEHVRLVFGEPDEDE